MRWVLSTSAALVACLATTVLAAPQQQTDRKEQVQRQQEAEQRQQERGPAGVGQVDERTPQSVVRLSELIGMDVQNAQGEKVGDIDDLVVDPKTGKIRYAAVSHGGFLGIGDDLFAVPWEAFQAGREQNGDNWVLILDVSKQELEKAQGFNEDNWPDFGDRQFTQRLDERYDVQRGDPQQRNQQDRDVNVDVQRGEGVEVDVDRENQ